MVGTVRMVGHQKAMLQYRVRYYPPTPMLLHMTNVLRLHGLFRDEHMDFREEMWRVQALRGKVTKIRFGPNAPVASPSKKDKKK